MLETRVTIVNELGLHARAAAQLVRLASAYRSKISIIRIDNSATANAKSILSVLNLAASKGTELQLGFEGEDEIEAMQAIETLVSGGFGER